jgi:predicted MFS family arabinose efflux permease
MEQHEVTCMQSAEGVGPGECAAGNRSCWGAIILLACGHLVGDFYGVLLTPLIQDFREAFALSVTAVTVLVNVGSLSNSTLQPIVGHFLEQFDQKRVFALGLLVVSGGILSLSTPVNIVVAQELHPDRASAMSGVMMGLAWSVSVVLLIPFGTLADLTSTATALSVSSLLLPIAGLCLVPLPEFPPLVRRNCSQDSGGVGRRF